MILEELALTHYRNLKQDRIFFHDQINVFIGKNAQGKTNLLEAIHVLALAKSHRTLYDRELIHWNEEYARIEGKVKKRQGCLPLRVLISKKGKKVKANHLEQRKLSDYVGVLNVVMFAPEDLGLIKGSPQKRRRFLDMEMAQISPLYMHELNQYQRILRQRNALLKDFQHQDSILDILTEQLISSAVKIIKKRRQFLDLLKQFTVPIHLAISRKKETLEIVYQSAVEVSEATDLSKMIETLKQKFAHLKDREVQQRSTLIGPHREDIAFFINGREVQTYGSQGQQRTVALSLKLAEIDLIAKEIGEYPLLLLDDVLSELDSNRQSQLLEAIRGKVQTFVTATSIDGIHHETVEAAVCYHIKDGIVTEKG